MEVCGIWLCVWNMALDSGGVWNIALVSGAVWNMALRVEVCVIWL